MRSILRQLLGRGGTVADEVQDKSGNVATPGIERQDAGEEIALTQARQQVSAQDVVAAQTLLEPFVAATRNLDLLVLAGRLAMVRGDFDASRVCYARAEALQSNSPAVWEALAELNHLLRDHRAELAYRRNLVFLTPQPEARACVAWLRCVVHAVGQGATVSLPEVELVAGKLGQAPDLTPAAQLSFAEQLYAIKKLVPRARALYLHALPPGLDELDQSVNWMSVADWAVQSGEQVSQASEAVGLDVVMLRGVCPLAGFQWVPLVGERRFALEGFLTRRVRLHTEQRESPVLLNGLRSLELRHGVDFDQVSTPALLLGGAPQYYHHTIEHLSRLAVAEAHQVDPSLPVVVNDDLAPFQLQQLAMLGYGEDRLIRVGTGRLVEFDRLTVPAVPVTGSRWMSPLIPRWARDRLVPLAHAAGRGDPASGRRLYVSRRGAARRRVANEEALMKPLADLGFVRVDPETLDVAAQIRLFSGAEVVVAPTGAALTNMIYMPAGGTVVVLYGDYAVAGIGGLYFDQLAIACGHRYQAMSGPGLAFNSASPLDADFEISPHGLADLLQALFQ